MFSMTKNTGSYKLTHPYKLKITCKEAVRLLRVHYYYAMFCWVYKDEYSCLNSMKRMREEVEAARTAEELNNLLKKLQ